MTKKEMKTAPLNHLIVELAQTNARLTGQMCTTGKTQQSGRHLRDVVSELLSRGVITERDAEILTT